MKAIILAAGEGSRLRPLSNTKPKPMIKIFGKNIIEHNLESIYKYLDEIIIVVKYKKEIIMDYFKDNFKGVKITYIEQGDDKGTGAAIRGIQMETGKKSPILILNGDSIFSTSDLEKIINLEGYGALVKKVDDPKKYGIFKQNQEGFATEIIEKPDVFVGDLANLGVYKFDTSIIEISKNIPLSKRGEYEITDSINDFLKQEKFKLIEVDGGFIDVGYPWHILIANSHFLNKLDRTEIEGEIEEGVTIKGKIILGEGAILKSGTYIEGNVYIGKNTVIGPNAYLRGNTVIGNDCKIGNAVEVKNSSIGDGTHIAHLSYIGDSILGENVNIGGGMITANLRHDKASVKVIIKEELVDSGLKKLGIIIGDNTKTGINTMTYPGRIIKNDSYTIPGEIIK
ncbi:MAG: sugar phosphate nucleotidyltransferase [Candidatus Gracilibacteria bacterium]|nr:sugar phosphate nucleotidyltransferase [Candidatus Gracilibacteria bacterium]